MGLNRNCGNNTSNLETLTPSLERNVRHLRNMGQEGGETLFSNLRITDSTNSVKATIIERYRKKYCE